MIQNLYNRAVSDAWNADGAPGICYTTDWNGKPVVHDRMHWTLAEAINASAVLHRVTGKEKYAADYAEFMKYLDDVLNVYIHGDMPEKIQRICKLHNTSEADPCKNYNLSYAFYLCHLSFLLHQLLKYYAAYRYAVFFPAYPHGFTHSIHHPCLSKYNQHFFQ